MSLKLVGHPISQPTRAVSWLLAIKNEPHEFIRISPIAGDTVKPDFLTKWPLGFVPAIEDSKFDAAAPFRCSEAGAILPYLCESRQWDEWYPSSSSSSAIRRRADINERLHWHHNAMRKCTVDCFRVHMIKYMKKEGMEVASDTSDLGPELEMPDEPAKGLHLAEHQKFLKSMRTPILEMSGNARWTEGDEKNIFMASGDQPSIADLMTYCEIDQLDYINSIDSLKKDFPLFNRWIEAMKKVEKHDEVRKPLKKMTKLMKEKGALGVEIPLKEQFFGVP